MAVVGYGEYLRGKVSSLVASCRRRVSNTTRLLLRRHHRQHSRRKTTTNNKQKEEEEAEAAAALWSRRILMGERCQPLDFAGAIHYDSFGRRLSEATVATSCYDDYLMTMHHNHNHAGRPDDTYIHITTSPPRIVPADP